MILAFDERAYCRAVSGSRKHTGDISWCHDQILALFVFLLCVSLLRWNLSSHASINSSGVQIIGHSYPFDSQTDLILV